MAILYLLDRLIPKHIAVTVPDTVGELPVGEKVVYMLPGDDKKYLWQNVWYPLEADKTGKFIEVLHDAGKEKLASYHTKAQRFYDVFKEQFPVVCPGAIPVTVRTDLGGQCIYFYFYSEERYNFADFVRSFREIVPVQFFIYQLGARDMMRYSPLAKEYLAACGCGPLGCYSLGKLPSVEMDNVTLQSLEWRDIEKLKWRCGKLKCSIIYERDLYLAELATFPKKGEIGTMQGKQCMCIGNNIMTGDIVAKTQDGEIMRWAKGTFASLAASEKIQRSE
jgi:cell fate regulator YaaT (PSP1 superfamily)